MALKVTDNHYGRLS